MNIRISRKVWFSVGVTLVLLILVWVVGTVVAQEPDGDQPKMVLGGSLTDTMTYQGRLQDGGSPANGFYDFRVNVWDAEVGGNQLGSTQVFDVTGIEVQDGLFILRFSPGGFNQVFTGGGRWIQLEVSPHGLNTYTTLDRQPITNVPYAWGLKPGAVISGSTGTQTGFSNAILNIDNTRELFGGGNSASLYVRASTASAIRAESGGVAVSGESTWTYAIKGNASIGTAGYFTSGDGYGIYARSDGADTWDHGGYFSASTGYGVYAQSEDNQAVRGEAGDVSTIVSALTTNGTMLNTPAGVAGLDQQRGVWGGSGSGTGTTGISDSGTGVAGISESGIGVLGSSTAGRGIVAFSGSGNLIEAWDWQPMYERRFYIDNAGNIHSTAETQMAINAFDIEATSELANNQYLSFLHHWLGYTEIENTSGTSSRTIFVPVHNLTQLLGSDLKLKSLQVCYEVASSSSYIDQTRVYYANSSGGRTEILTNLSNRTSTSWDCYTVTNGTPITIDGPLLIYFNLYYSGTGSGHKITIGQITATLVE